MQNGWPPLEAAKAFRLAARLVVVPGFDRRDEAIEAMADWLIDHCRGAVLAEQDRWSPERQARYLIDTVIDEWDHWQGASAMGRLLRAKFYPPEAQRPFESVGAGPPACLRCKDTGTVRAATGEYTWCQCRQGQEMRLEIPQWLELVNRTATPARADPAPAELPSAVRRQQIQAEIDQLLAARAKNGQQPPASDNDDQELEGDPDETSV